MIAKPARAKRIATAPYALGALTPTRIVEPHDGAEAAAILRAASDAGEAVVAYGGGTLQSAANAPTRYDVALSTKRLNALHEYDPRELTAGVGGGMTVAELNALLARNHQFLPLDAPLAAQATIGGTLACPDIAVGGETRANNCRISVELIMRGARLDNPGGIAFFAGGLEVAGGVGHWGRLRRVEDRPSRSGRDATDDHIG